MSDQSIFLSLGFFVAAVLTIWIAKTESNKLIRRTDNLEKMYKDNSALLSIVCHDIATPVMIANYSLTRLVRNSAALGAEDLANVYKIEKNLKAVSEILRNVKSLHATKLGKLEPLIQDLDVEPLIFEVTEMFQPMCEEKNVQLIFTVKDHLSKIVKLDPILFKNQILGNLLSNAIKFSERGQDIHIYLSRVNNEVVIDVVDYGKGIVDAQLDHLFDFHKPTSTLGTASEVGTGLGLPMVKMMTEKMGGRVNVLSDTYCEQGTKFTLNFKCVS